MNCPECHFTLHQHQIGRPGGIARRIQVRCDKCGYLAVWEVIDEQARVKRVLRGRGNMCILGELSSDYRK